MTAAMRNQNIASDATVSLTDRTQRREQINDSKTTKFVRVSELENLTRLSDALTSGFRHLSASKTELNKHSK